MVCLTQLLLLSQGEHGGMSHPFGTGAGDGAAQKCFFYQLLGAAPGPVGGHGPRQVGNHCPQEPAKEDFGNYKGGGISCQENSDPQVLGIALFFPQDLVRVVVCHSSKLV